MDNFIKIISLLWDSGILTAVALFAIKFLQSHTKNAKLKTLNEYALQAVANADASITGNAEKYEAAYKTLSDLIDNSGIKFNVPEEQKKSLIEAAVKLLKSYKN